MPKKTPRPPAAAKPKSSLWDDDDLPPPPKKPPSALLDDDDEPKLVPGRVVTPAPEPLLPVIVEVAAVPVVEKPKAAPKPVEQVLVRQLATPPGFHNIQTKGGVRITIIDRLGADFKDVYAYNWDMKVTMHLKIEDLIPADAVQSAVAFLNDLRK